MKTHLKAAAVTTVVMTLVLVARPVVAFPLGSGTFGTSIFGDSDGDLVQDAFDAFPLMGAVTVMQIWTVCQTNGKPPTA